MMLSTCKKSRLIGSSESMSSISLLSPSYSFSVRVHTGLWHKSADGELVKVSHSAQLGGSMLKWRYSFAVVLKVRRI